VASVRPGPLKCGGFWTQAAYARIDISTINSTGTIVM